MGRILVSILILCFGFSTQALARAAPAKSKKSHHKSTKKASKHSAHSAHKSGKNHVKNQSKQKGPRPASVLPEKESSAGAARVRRDYFQGQN